MTALKHRTVEQDGDRLWLVYGPDGVISWTLLPNGIYGPIGIHSPTPMLEGHTPVNDCPWLEGPCCVDSGFLGGDHVGRTWDEAGRDDEVIWPVLEAWYAAHLPRGGES
jgi:hypothetical protein